MNRLDKFITDWFSDVKSVYDISFGQFLFAFAFCLWCPFYRFFKEMKAVFQEKNELESC